MKNFGILLPTKSITAILQIRRIDYIRAYRTTSKTCERVKIYGLWGCPKIPLDAFIKAVKDIFPGVSVEKNYAQYETSKPMLRGVTFRMPYPK